MSFCQAGADETSCPAGAPGVLVPEGRLFVMGDHRCCSSDSRLHLDDGQRGHGRRGRGHRPGVRRGLAPRPGERAARAGCVRPAARWAWPPGATRRRPVRPRRSGAPSRSGCCGDADGAAGAGEDVRQARRRRPRRAGAAARLRRPGRPGDPLVGAARRWHRGRERTACRRACGRCSRRPASLCRRGRRAAAVDAGRRLHLAPPAACRTARGPRRAADPAGGRPPGRAHRAPRRARILGMRWWTPDEVAAHPGRFFPRSLPALLPRLLAGRARRRAARRLGPAGRAAADLGCAA